MEKVKEFFENIWDWIVEQWEDNRKIFLGVLIGALILIIALFFIIGVIKGNQKPSVPTEQIVVEPLEEKHPMNIELRSEYLANKKANPDYVGKIEFESGLIIKEFVQADDLYDSNGKFYKFYDEWGNVISEKNTDFACDEHQCTGNDVYIWQNWRTGEYDRLDQGGSVFMDWRNTLDDENIIIYGHHFSTWNDENRNKAFTPLEFLTNEENYETNKNITLVLDNEIRKYQIAYIFEYDINNPSGMEYYRTNYSKSLTGDYDPTYKMKYFETIRNHAYYDTGVDLSETDRTLTLQTCYSSRPNYREIVVCKELSREKFTD